MAQQTTASMPVQTNLIVGTEPLMAGVLENPTRNGLIIANNGTDPINIAFGSHVPSETSGIPIAAGTVFSLLPRTNDSCALGAAVNFIAAQADTPATVLEF